MFSLVFLLLLGSWFVWGFFVWLGFWFFFSLFKREPLLFSSYWQAEGLMYVKHRKGFLNLEMKPC